MNAPRYAIYYAPPAETAVARLGAVWLGRDADTGGRLAQPAVPGLAAAHVSRLTAAPRRYGFHATLRAPFRLAPDASLDSLTRAARTLAESLAPVSMPALKLTRMVHFLALTPQDDGAAVRALAARCVEHLDPFRATLTDDELKRRWSATLSEAQERLLMRWGYPYVMDAFRFHMTLTDQVTDSEAASLSAFLNDYFRDVLDRPFVIDRLSLFVQPAPDAPFRRIAAFPMTGRPAAREGRQPGADKAA